MICPKCGHRLQLLSTHAVGSSLTGMPSTATGCSCLLCGYWREMNKNPEKPLPEKPVIPRRGVIGDGMLMIDRMRPLYDEIQQLRKDGMMWKGIIRRLNLSGHYDAITKTFNKLVTEMEGQT